nr:hypothetical protein CoNPh37_CDS0195 [Staphylococcus phage S-CoN_Ph37]
MNNIFTFSDISSLRSSSLSIIISKISCKRLMLFLLFHNMSFSLYLLFSNRYHIFF